MQPLDKTPPDTPPAEELDKLHEKVNAMLDVPLPKEGDAWPLPLESSLEPTLEGGDTEPSRAGPT